MQSITTGGRTPSPRQPRWHAAPTAIISLTVLTSLLLACAPAAQPAATSAPALAPATSAPVKPAQPAAQPAASPAAAQVEAQGQLVVVSEAEPDTIVPKDASSNISHLMMDNVYDQLTWRDYSSGEPKIVGGLAESWSRVDPTTWRFKLRQGIKFTNGEAFTADAVVTAVMDLVNPAAPGRLLGEYGDLTGAKQVDEFTVDITTKSPDAILPVRLVRFPIPAPGWLKGASLETQANAAVGSGPYVLAEWKKGDSMLLRANENYWGPHKAKIREVKLLGRKEATVRGSMVQTGEAQIGFRIPPEMVKQVSRTIIEPATEAVAIRINPQHPVMKDLRVRQAMVYAINSQGILDALYPGGIAEVLSGQVMRKGSVGYNPNLKPYPYQPEQAKQLMQEAGAVGTSVDLVNRPNYFPKADELAEIVANSLGQIGLKVSIKNMEAAQWTEALNAVKPGQAHVDLILRNVSNSVLDSSRVLDQSYICGGRFSLLCDQTFTEKVRQAGDLSGAERDKAYQAIWAEAYDQYWFIPILGQDYVHAASPKVKWKPRTDSIVLFNAMELDD